MPPTAIGPYKIERELGRGGKDVVLLATDSRLDRQVAIKAIPAHMDADRLARFQRSCPPAPEAMARYTPPAGPAPTAPG